jgi:acyl-CoA synthetase (AMP-forming)/AMP-acid ligase II
VTDLYGSRTVWELVERRADTTPDRPMLLVDGRPPLTFGQFRTGAERAAAGLVERGVGPGSTVAWQLPTTPEAVVTWAALARLGARQVPMLLFYREREVAFILRETGAQLVLGPGTYGGVDHAALAGDVPTVDVLATPLDGDPSTLPPAPSEDGERFTY